MLPVYLAIDTSASMDPGIEDLNRALRSFIHVILEPIMADNVRISILSFSDSAQLLQPMTSVYDLQQVPMLQSSGGTAYGPVLRLLRESIPRDVENLRLEGKPIFRPLVLFVTDGSPTDHWQTACAELHDPSFPYRPTVVAIGFYSADPNILRSIAGQRGHMFIVAEQVSPSDAIDSIFDGLGRTLVATTKSSVSGASVGQIPVPSEWIDLSEERN